LNRLTINNSPKLWRVLDGHREFINLHYQRVDELLKVLYDIGMESYESFTNDHWFELKLVFKNKKRYSIKGNWFNGTLRFSKGE